MSNIIQIELSPDSILKIREAVREEVRSEMLKIHEKDEWLSTNEACQLLGCSTTALWKFRRSHKMKMYRVGRQNRFLRSEIEALIKTESK
jgi:excisionase family DNA binding protein